MTTALDVERFRSAVARRLGFQFPDDRLEPLAELLHQRMTSLGFGRTDDYLERLDAEPTRADELRVVARQLTVGETFFFRDRDQMNAFAEAVLPGVIEARGSERDLHILSAGCSSGDEAYSLAALVREGFPDLESWRVKITGVDVNRAMLEKAREGRYSEWSLRATPEPMRQRYFKRLGHEFALDPALRGMVSFEEGNLVEEGGDWSQNTYDVIFCRNVLMYFAPAVMRRVVARLMSVLRPGGYLFVGHAETLRGLPHDLQLCHTHATFYYRSTGSSPQWLVSPGDAETAGIVKREWPAIGEASASWVDAIQRASERVAALASRHAGPSAPTRQTDDSLAPDLEPVREAMKRERYEDALNLLKALPPGAHDDPDALLLRAALLTNDGRLGEAQEVCVRLLELEDRNAGAHYLQALCREHAGDSAGAMDHDQMAIHLDGAFAMPHLHAGMLARRIGDEDMARRELVQALILLEREDAARILLFGGGFSRQALVNLCRSELRGVGGAR